VVRPVRLTPEQRRLVEGNVALAKFLARLSWEKNRNQMELQEAVSVAYQGLVNAAIRFDPYAHGMSQETIDNGKAFSAFARTKITGAILDWQKGSDYVQRSVRTDYRAIVAAGYLGDLQKDPLPSVLAERTGLAEDRIRKVAQAVQLSPISTEDLLDESGTSEPLHHGVESSAVESSITSTAANVVQELPPLAQVIVALRYYSGFELQTIASQLGISLALVRETHSEAVLSMHQAMLHKVRD
jgi:RNA polymerase sigma factor (sigma-70 family)